MMMRGVAPRSDDLKREFGQRLGSLRQARGIKRQEDLADASGISLRQIAAYERGESLPRYEQLLDLAAVLVVSLDELAGLPPGRRLDPRLREPLEELERSLDVQRRTLTRLLAIVQDDDDANATAS